MNVNDLLLSINVALYEEQRRAYNNKELFNRDELTIMATRKVVFSIADQFTHYMNFRIDEKTTCMGCKVVIIDGDGDDIYIARKVTILTAKLGEEVRK